MKILHWLWLAFGGLLLLIASISCVVLIALMFYHYWYLWLIAVFGYMIGMLIIQKDT